MVVVRGQIITAELGQTSTIDSQFVILSTH